MLVRLMQQESFDSMNKYAGNNYDANFFLDVMLNETDECIIFVDVEGKIVELSDAYAKFLKVKKEEVIGKSQGGRNAALKMHV